MLLPLTVLQDQRQLDWFLSCRNLNCRLPERDRPVVLILVLGGLKVRRIDSGHGYFRAELTVIPSVCGDSGEIDPEVARHLRLSFGQAEGKECALPDGRLWHGGVFGVLHAKPILPGASAPTGGGSRVWSLEL